LFQFRVFFSLTLSATSVFRRTTLSTHTILIHTTIQETA
jgi:hypothetical protein